MCEEEADLGCQTRLLRSSVEPLSEDQGRVRYAQGQAKRRDRQQFRACKSSCQGATATPATVFPSELPIIAIEGSRQRQ